MNIKQYKANVENLAVNFLKQTLSDTIKITAEFNCNSNALTASIQEDRKNNDVLDSILVYNCQFADGNLTVAAFLRRYIMDSYGVALVVNEPAIVDTNFMNAIAQCLEAALRSADDSEPEAPSESVNNAETVENVG